MHANSDAANAHFQACNQHATDIWRLVNINFIHSFLLSWIHILFLHNKTVFTFMCLQETLWVVCVGVSLHTTLAAAGQATLQHFILYFAAVKTLHKLHKAF